MERTASSEKYAATTKTCYWWLKGRPTTSISVKRLHATFTGGQNTWDHARTDRVYSAVSERHIVRFRLKIKSG